FDTIGIYVLASCGLFLIIIITTNLLPLILCFVSGIYILARKLFSYGYILQRHRWIGPWSIGSVLVQSVFVIVNLFCLLFRASSSSESSLRAGRLALINMAPLFLGPHLGFLADSLGVSLRTFHKVHCSSGLMSFSLTLIHVCIMSLNGNNQDLYTSLGALSLLLIMVLSIPYLRNLIYELFLRSHQALALFLASAIWRHLLRVPNFPWLYIYIYAGVACLSSTIYFVNVLYRNLKLGSALPQALLESNDGSIHIKIDLPRPAIIDAGQYINLWIWAPKVSLCSLMQSHPFTVTSWSLIEQESLDLLIQPRAGLTSKLTRATDMKYLAFFSGPHGKTFPISDYKSVILVAMDFGIVGMLPYLTKLIHGYKLFTSRTCRIHLVWHI
ncbi:hypothetical protein BX600DRAFT_356869, partial [Xylariales sp. PMI_506]